MEKWDNFKSWWAEKNLELENNDQLANETTEELNFLLGNKDAKSHKIATLFSVRRLRTQKIIHQIKVMKPKITEFLFYTFNENIIWILEYGIFPKNLWSDIARSKNYKTTFLEHDTYIQLELSDSNRLFLWEWIRRNKIDPNSIAIISININELYNYTLNNWGFNNITKQVTINEPIPVNCINWILIKSYPDVERITKYIKRNKLNIKLYYGDEGSVEDETASLQ